MAITKNECTLLFYAKKLGVSFRESLMLGRMTLLTSKEDILRIMEKYGSQEKDITEVKFTDDYSEPLFEMMGAKTIDSMDFSTYEKATIIHDLNVPIPENLKNKYSVVLDGGTIEHVFNFPVAIKNSMEALKVGGHFLGVSPANNQMGHGFYQFSPELYFRVFSEVNGFKIIKLLINVNAANDTNWYEVADPFLVNDRVMLVNNLPVTMMIIAEKTAAKNIFETIPQQIDYANTWNAHQSLTENKMQPNESKLKFIYRKTVPKRLKVFFRNLYNLLFVEKAKDEFLGEFNPKHFIKTNL
jgi:hypothetical protein